MVIIQETLFQRDFAQEYIEISGSIVLLILGALFKRLNWKKGYQALLPLWIILEGLILSTQRFIIKRDTSYNSSYYSNLRLQFIIKYFLTVMFDVIELKYMIFVHIPIFISLISVMLVFEVKSSQQQTADDQKF